MNRLPNKKSSGHDGINNIILKEIGEYICTPLTYLFNESMTMGVFPDAMKIAEVVPLYKGKARYEGENYRPISLLLTISKLLEKLMYSRVYDYQEELKAKLISIENRTLENCLVFRGLPESEYEKESKTRKKIKEAFKNLISSNSDEEAEQSVKHFEIRRCKRLGKYFKDRARPISVDFLRKDDTDYIMENKSQLPGGVYADREYNRETERKRKLLRPILKAARQHKDFQGRCKMDRDTLLLRGKCYTVNTIDQLPNSLSTVNVTSKSNETTFSYFGELNPLSNFHPSPFKMYDQEYHCSEQYIQEAKAKYFNDIETYDKLHNTNTGLECKLIAKQTKNFNVKKWEQVAKDICKPGIKQKFQMNPNPRHMLLDHTKNKLIIECTKDTLWGTGVPLDNEKCLDSSMWKGHGTKKQGIMGEILCEIRNELEDASKDLTSHTVLLPAPLQQQTAPPSQNVAAYTTNHCLNYGFSAISEAPISSNRMDIPTPIGTITDSSMLPQHPGT